MKVFITGHMGFLGSHLVDYWLAQGAEVLGIDNESGGDIRNLPEAYFQQDIMQNAHSDFLDITYEYAKEYIAMQAKDFDVLYHCAAAPYEGVSVFSPSYITDNILSGSVNVFTGAIMGGVKRIVNCSSMARYGAVRTPFSEDMVCAPQDPYGIAKLAAEDVLRVLSKVHGIEYAIAVPHNIYGPKQKYDDPYRNVASIMANRMLQGKPPIVYGDGTQRRCFSYIDDCVSCLAKMATQSNVVGEVINIGPDNDDISINHLVWMLNIIIGSKFEPIYMPDRPQEVKVAHCSSKKAKLILDFKIKMNCFEGMTKLVEYIKEKGPKEFQYDHVPIEIENDHTPKTWTERII